MTKTAKINKIKKASTLGYSKVVKADTVVRAGCTKSFTNDCGISYRGS
jgi:hypothetical protein